MVKKLVDICLNCIGQSLNSISQVGSLLPTKHKEILLQRLADHDMLTPEYLPRVTYHLFSPALRSIRFKKCKQLTDGVLLQLVACKCQLESLVISKCEQVSDFGMQSLLSKQTKLRVIKLTGLPLVTCKSLEAINCPDTLEHVTLHCSNIANKGIQSLVSKNPGITKISFGPPMAKITEDIVCIVALSLGINLVDINLSDLNTLSNKSLTSLAEHCPNLRSLNLSGCNRITSEALLLVFNNCTNLQDLDMSFCYKILTVNSNILDHLPLSITSLFVGGLEIDGAKLERALVRLPKLKELRLCPINVISEEVLEEIFSVIGGRLTLVDMSGCHQSMTDHALRSIVRYCTELEHLSVSYCVHLTGEALVTLLRDPRRAKSLTSLKLNGCKEILHMILLEIALSCANLETLYLAGLRCVDDSILRDFANNCPKLRDVSIKSSTGMDSQHQVTDQGVLELVRCCPIEYLVVSGIHKLTDKSIISLANCCPDLKCLYASGCSMITATGMRYLEDMCNERVYIVHKIPNLDPNQIMAKNLDTGEFCRVDQLH